MHRADRRRGRSTAAGALVIAALAAGLAALTARAAPAAPRAGAAAGAFAQQAAAGMATYETTCLACHGDHGQGVPGRSEPTEGRLFQQRNPTALVIFDVVRSGREPDLRALTDDQVWAAIAAELANNGVDLGDRMLGAGNAARVTTGPAASPSAHRFFPPGH